MPLFSSPTKKESRIWQKHSEAHSSREMEEEKGIGLISNICVVFSASSNQLPSNRATTPLWRTCTEGVTQLHTLHPWPLYLTPSPAIIVHFISLQKLQRTLSPASLLLFPTSCLLQPSFPWLEFMLPLGRLHIHFTQ